MVRVERVAPSSLGSELGLIPGTELLSIDGRPLRDFLDWEFLSADDHFVLGTRFPDGAEVEYDIERPEGLPTGVVLEPPRVRRCANHCDFCFVDGLPAGLRASLYVRDDDYRLSFRYGNFATLTNLKPRDVERIVEYRLSPLYVSVHATDPVVRRRILRNPRAPDVLEQIHFFAERGIRFHTQIVIQPGANDGPVLERSLVDLYQLGDAVRTVSVVPVGLTEFSRRDLVRELTRAECRAAVDVVARMAQQALPARARRWAYASDDLYLGAALPLPPIEAYDGLEQSENGVGSVRHLQQRIQERGRDLTDLSGRRVGVLTGMAMAPLMPMVLETLTAFTGGSFELIAIENDLFGPTVTSAGLLPGSAFASALSGRTDLDLALLPAEALNDDGVFLDDVSFGEIAATVPVILRASGDFADVLGKGPKDE